MHFFLTMYSRRSFLHLSGTALAAAAFPLQSFACLAASPRARQLSVQLYSIRDDMAKDPAGAVRALAQMGYTAVEGYGQQEGKMFGMSIVDFSKLLKDNGLKMPSSHFNLKLQDWDEQKKDLRDDLKSRIDLAAASGQHYLVNPWMESKDRDSIQQWIPLLNAAATYVHKAGMRFGYHNHDFEFTKKGPDNRLLIEWLLHEVDPAHMTMEMDLYWVCYAGHNPLDWFRLYPGRWELCHVKDMAKTERRETVEVGDGSLDFAAIFKQSQQAGLRQYVIE
ncbi:MAG TPA: TIM barrel protein, partial [Saprospiraceae bacterium]|nr:TIM barrel protein [Saprospiraceae bacterium]